MRVVYFFGAGASASINNKRVPVMANFFERAIELLDENNYLFLVAFAVAEEARAFPSNSTIENVGIRIGTLGRLLQNMKQEKRNPSRVYVRVLEKSLKEYIHAYKQEFKSDKNRLSANLEEVFGRVEFYKSINRTADNAYDRIQFVIGDLFGRLDKELLADFRSAAHHDLVKFVANSGGITHTFISFNYDPWLEKALTGRRLWHPEHGHGSYCFKYYSPPIEDPSRSKGVVVEDICQPKTFKKHNYTKTKVLKPHGSLSWRYGRDTQNVVVILENDEQSCVTYNKTWYFPPSLFKEGNDRTLIPLVVPPTQNKIRSHPLFWQIDQDIVEALSQADAVVIIGWSMPETDQYIRDMLMRALNARKGQIKKMVICDIGDRGKKMGAKFEVVFRPKETRIYNEGFSKEFVKFLQKEL